MQLFLWLCVLLTPTLPQHHPHNSHHKSVQKLRILEEVDDDPDLLFLDSETNSNDDEDSDIDWDLIRRWDEKAKQSRIGSSIPSVDDIVESNEYAKWLQDMYLGTDGKWNPNARFSTILVPGSHDAQSFPTAYSRNRFQSAGVMNVQSGTAFKSLAATAGMFTTVQSTAYRYGVAQAADLYNQMKAGSRYFDLRCFWHASRRDLYTHHGYLNDALILLLQNTQQFIIDYQDPVILRLKYEGSKKKYLFWNSWTNEARYRLEEILSSLVDELHVPSKTRNLAEVHLSDLVGNKRLILVSAGWPKDEKTRSILATYTFDEALSKSGKAPTNWSVGQVLNKQRALSDRPTKIVTLYLTVTHSMQKTTVSQYRSLMAKTLDRIPTVLTNLMKTTDSPIRFVNVVMLDMVNRLNPILMELIKYENEQRKTRSSLKMEKIHLDFVGDIDVLEEESTATSKLVKE